MEPVKVDCLTFTASVLIILLSGLDHIAANTIPEITLAPSPHGVIQGDTISFFCRASGNPSPTFVWEINGKEISGRSRRIFDSELFNKIPHISVLRIKDVKPRFHNASFTCVASNDEGEARAAANLFVYKRKSPSKRPSNLPEGYPIIVSGPTLRSVELGQNVLLNCDSRGDPKPQVMWLKDSFPLDFSNGRTQITEKGYLRIRNAMESDQAVYECVAENKWGTAYSYGARVYVRIRRIPPRIYKISDDQTVFPGSDVDLTCSSIGRPQPFVRWLDGATSLSEEDSIPQGTNVLSLRNIQRSKNYTCEASSDLGKTARTVQVIVSAPGSPPENVKVKDVSPSTITLQWDPPKITNGAIEGYKVFYTKDPAAPIFFWEVESFNNKSTQQTLVGLQENQEYTISILAFSASGQSSLSLPIQASTRVGGVPPRIYKITDDQTVFPGSDVDLTCSSLGTPQPFVKWLDGAISLSEEDSIPEETNVLSLRNVQRSKNYTCEASNPLGKTVHTVQVIVNAPGSPPENVKVKDVSPSTITLQWDPPKITNGAIEGYKVFYTTDPGDPLFFWEVESFNSKSTQETLVGLQENEEYSISILAFSANGQGPLSPPIEVFTSVYVPLNITEVSDHQTVVAGSDVNLTCTAVGTRLPYVRWVEDGIPLINEENGEEVVPRGTNILSLTNVQQSKNYTCEAFNGQENASRTVEVTVSVPNTSPRNVKAKLMGSATLLVSWEPPEMSNDEIKGYKLYYTTMPTTPVYFWKSRVVRSDKTSAILGGLRANETYTISVLAFHAVGHSSMSDRIQVLVEQGVTPNTDRPQVISIEKDSLLIQLKRPSQESGVVSHYHIIVVPNKSQATDKLPRTTDESWFFLFSPPVNSTKTNMYGYMHISKDGSLQSGSTNLLGYD